MIPKSPASRVPYRTTLNPTRPNRTVPRHTGPHRALPETAPGGNDPPYANGATGAYAAFPFFP